MPTCETAPSAKTFVLGVGAQKAGTTWLHQYLSSYACADFGMHKEYHIWDAIFSELCAEFKVTPEMFVDTVADGLVANDASILRYAMQHFPAVYPAYFAHLLTGKKWLTGDITPAYACLDKDALLQVKQSIESAGMQVKAVFLMRDPFERCWSAIRMYKRMADLEGSDEECLARLYRSERFRFRTAYQETIGALECVFSPESIFYGFYESLFTAETLDRLSDFLGIPPNYAAIEQHFNASPKSEHCRPDLRLEVIRFYEDVYAFCRNRFPETKVLWHQP
jgi:hypothetical protein